MKKIDFKHLETTQGGTFCAAFGATASVYGLGAAANLWNPIGWGGTAAIVAVGVGCAVYHWD